MSGFEVTAIIAGIVAVIWSIHCFNANRREEKRRRRREQLIAKYGSEEIADAIMAQKIWQGMTSEQLADSWGQPADVDTKVFKRKTSETWKYGQIGKNRFSQRVFTENGVVVGWQQQ